MMRNRISILQRFLHTSKTLNISYLHNNTGICLPQRATAIITAKLSNRKTGLPKMLSDVEELVARDFTLSDLEKKVNGEQLPATVSKATELRKVRGVDEVLENVTKSTPLIPDELVLYFGALIRNMQLIDNRLDSGSIGKSFKRTDLLNLHDSTSFQFLIKESLSHAYKLPTSQLALVYIGLAKLQVPPLSNTMLLFTSVIQDRINEFFPMDVYRCLKAINMLKEQSEGLSYVDSLHQGFIMHLENQMFDPPTFNQILKCTTIAMRLKLLFSTSGELSKDLQVFLTRSVKSTVDDEGVRAFRTPADAEMLLKYLSRRHRPRKQFYLVVSRYYEENPHLLKPPIKGLLSKVESILYPD